jgi:ribosomal protein L29
MSLPQYKELSTLLNLEEIDQEIFVLQKSLFDLRMKKSTSQAIKPHLFLHAKRRIAQLKFKKSILLKTTN